MDDAATGFDGDDDGLAGKTEGKRLVSRISVSLSEELLCELDAIVGKLGFANRSQAVSSILHGSLVNHRQQIGDRVMVGTITLFYSHGAGGVQARLASLQRRHIDEVISSLHVHLVNDQTLEVLLVQGPAAKLQAIANAMITERGVISGRLEVVASLIPPLHPFEADTKV
jgi:CopG family nickel-responsive transcriptional regulator